MSHWHEDDEFWRAFGPFMFTPERVQAAEAEAEALVRLLGLDPARTPAILDLPCGVGRHSIALARLGFKVTGVDRTGAFLDLARSRTPGGVRVEWRQGDVREFDGGGGYDAVLNLFTSIGYFEDQDENVRALANLRRALKPGGRLLVDVLGKETLTRIYRQKHWDELPDGTVHLADARMVEHLSKMTNRWVLIRPDGTRFETMVRHWVYSAEELNGLLERAGFADRRFFGSLAGGPYDLNAERLVVVASAG